MDVKLIMFREDGTRRDIPLSLGTSTIGRQEDCTIRIPLAEVSRRHAEIELDEHEALLIDHGAANGTYLNSRRINGEEVLEPGDQISIGPVVFTVQVDGEPADDEIVPVRSTHSRQPSLGSSGVGIGTSKHVVVSDEEIDPIAALESLASSTDQTAINLEDDDDDLDIELELDDDDDKGGLGRKSKD